MEEFLENVMNIGERAVNPRELSPLVLAYIGDAVYEIYVRTLVLQEGNMPVNKLNNKARRIVNAKAQSDSYFRIEEILTDEELAVFKRGRNAQSHTSPKNADISDYRHATGLEALYGYLYLSKRFDRLNELFKLGMYNEE